MKWFDGADTPSEKPVKRRYSKARYEALMDDYFQRTGERISPPPTVLAVVPLLRRSPRQAADPSDVAVWFLRLDDGRPMFVIEKPRDPDLPPVDVLLSHLGRYGRAHRDVVNVMIEATRINRKARAKLERAVSMSHETVVKEALGGLAVDAADARRQIEVERRKIDFMSIFTPDFVDARWRFMALCNVSARFIRRYGDGRPSSWFMDPRSIAIPIAFQTGLGRTGDWEFWIPPCDKLAQKWDAWDMEYRAIESTHPRLPLLDAIIDFRTASDQGAWPFSTRDPLLDWTNGTGVEFPWPDALLTLGSDFPNKIRMLRFSAGGWWRYVDGKGEVFYRC
jgi:hypothetical protein